MPVADAVGTLSFEEEEGGGGVYVLVAGRINNLYSCSMGAQLLMVALMQVC